MEGSVRKESSARRGSVATRLLADIPLFSHFTKNGEAGDREEAYDQTALP